MKATLTDEKTPRPTLLLRDAVSTKAPFRDTEAVAGCNCDRWGHPCPSCSDATIQPKPKVPISSAATTPRVNIWNT